jgi:hypothetical protein
MTETWFTPATARCALPRLQQVAQTLHRLYAEMETRRPADSSSDRRVDPLYFAMLDRLLRGLDRLQRAGLRVDDLRHGLLDFPALLDGHRVLLCWRVGEPSLDFWREPGNRERRMLVDDADAWEAPPGRGASLC